MDELVPGSRHYDRTYLSNGRPFSFAVQWDAVMQVDPRSVLEIGVGAGVSAFALRRAGLDVTTLDVQPELAPDIVGDVRAIPRPDASFDAACCCQVLEHLPYAELPKAITEIRRVTRRRLVLSVPDITRSIGLTIGLASRGLRSFEWSLPVREPDAAWRAERLREMGHYWEIGVDGIRAGAIDATLRDAGFARVRSMRVRELPWHRFFIADIG
jgi:ubiquinone/menaquinone biosynthesis C-methylase UbiE